jgi:hypothetical protein
MAHPSSPGRQASATLLVAALALPSALLAHGSNAPYIAFWGPFSTTAARCQRQIGASVRTCVERVVRHELDCSTEHNLPNCDAPAQTAVRRAAVELGRKQVAELCSAADVRELLFIDLAEVQTDLEQACRQEASRLRDQLLAVSLADLSGPCQRQLRTVGRQMLGRALRAKRFALNPIATHNMPPSRRLGRINNCQRRLTKTRGLLANRLRRHCPQLEAVYGASAEEWLLDLEMSTDCIIWSAYIQSAFTCAR